MTAAPVMSQVHPVMVTTPTAPFGVAVTPDGRWAFVASQASIEKVRLTGAPAPSISGTLRVKGDLAGATVTRDGRFLLVASGSGAIVMSVARAEDGAPAVLGTLSNPTADGLDAIETAVSADGQYAFVSEEYHDQVAVFSLRRALSEGFGPGDYIGSIPLGHAVVGMAVSPDGDWLYVTSELAAGKSPGRSTYGTLSVIDVRRAATDPAAAVAATVAAGCDPVRVVTSADGSDVWVTARESNALLCFDAGRLRSDPRHALRAVVRVGAAPVGLAIARGGTRVVVADSNRFGTGAGADLAVVDVNAALAGRPAVLGRVSAGRFPRDMAVTPDGQTVLIANYDSAQLEVVTAASLP